MKRLIYLFAIAVICSCSGGSSFTISGEIMGVNAGDSIKVCSYFDKDLSYTAGVVAEDGTFSLSGKVDEPNIAALILNNRSLLSLVILESGEIVISTDDQGSVIATGTKCNNAMTQYDFESSLMEERFKSVDRSLDPEEVQAAQTAIYEEYCEYLSATVDANTDNIFGAFIFASEELRGMSGTEAKEHLDRFSKEVLELDFMVETAQSIADMLRTEVGERYIDITLSDVDGEDIAVSELLATGKYVLIDFWATWCGPCMAELPHLQEVYAEYSSKGFEIYGVSLDQNINDWKGLIGRGVMPWVNVIDNEESTATADYVVRTIPSNFLISPEGIIVAKNLRGEELATTVAEFVK